MIMGSLANGSERFTGMWGAHQRTVPNGSLVANYLELFGTIWNYLELCGLGGVFTSERI